MPVINIPMRVVPRLPSVTPLSGPLILASLTGRKTGKAYRQLLSYMQQGKTLLTPSGAIGGSTYATVSRCGSGYADVMYSHDPSS